ncbi:uncharacterized protein LOC143281510 [Babylonia areolata]|uniref:uncharacterized protein LOC143281510 n=1 Tax=Babylonia areolata TaxID=304850 RepID=UPI003FD1418F
MKINVVFCVIVICFLPSIVSTKPSTASAVECPTELNTCRCLYGNADGAEDHRTLGLAAATGALGGVLATGAAFAAYLHFRSLGGGGGGGLKGGSPGAGVGSEDLPGPGNSSPPFPRSQRVDSVASSSADSVDSHSPLTQQDKLTQESRFRPNTGSSNVTNIYRHARVWPGRF